MVFTEKTKHLSITVVTNDFIKFVYFILNRKMMYPQTY